MKKSAKFIFGYCAWIVVIATVTGLLTNQLWVAQLDPHTLGHSLRIVGLIFVPLMGLAMLTNMIVDPVAWRFFRMLNRANTSNQK